MVVQYFIAAMASNSSRVRAAVMKTIARIALGDESMSWDLPLFPEDCITINLILKNHSPALNITTTNRSKKI